MRPILLFQKTTELADIELDNLKAQCDSVLPGVKANLLVAQSMAEKILSRDSKSEIVSSNTDLSSSGAATRLFFNSKIQNR